MRLPLFDFGIQYPSRLCSKVPTVQTPDLPMSIIDDYFVSLVASSDSWAGHVRQMPDRCKVYRRAGDTLRRRAPVDTAVSGHVARARSTPTATHARLNGRRALSISAYRVCPLGRRRIACSRSRLGVRRLIAQTVAELVSVLTTAIRNGGLCITLVGSARKIAYGRNRAAGVVQIVGVATTE